MNNQVTFECFLLDSLPLELFEQRESHTPLMLYNEEEATWALELGSETKGGWYHVSAQKEVEQQTGWIQLKHQLGVYSNNYTDTLKIFARPEGQKVEYQSSQFVTAPMRIIVIGSSRVRVDFTWQGASVSGWVSRKQLCGNPYSTCP